MDEAPSMTSVMELAREDAIQLGHDYIGTEHQLLGLLQAGDADVMRLIASHGVTAPEIRTALLEAIPPGTPGRVDPSVPLPYTSRAKIVLNIAAAEAAAPGQKASDGLRLLRAFFLEDRNVAAGVLRKLGVTSA